MGDTHALEGVSRQIAYDPASGKELWRTTVVESNAIPSAVFGHGNGVRLRGFPTKTCHGHPPSRH